MTRTADGPQRRLSWSARLGGALTLALLSGAIGLIGDPGTALASAPEIPCPPDIGTLPGTVNAAQPDGSPPPVLVRYRYSIAAAVPTFYVSDSRSVSNGLDTPVSATFTSQQSQTVSVTVAVGSTAKLTEQLQATVNVSILSSRTTSIGVSVTATIPAHTTVVGQYGVDGYAIAYDAQKIFWSPSARRCTDGGTERYNTAAPTTSEGWRLATT